MREWIGTLLPAANPSDVEARLSALEARMEEVAADTAAARHLAAARDRDLADLGIKVDANRSAINALGVQTAARRFALDWGHRRAAAWSRDRGSEHRVGNDRFRDRFGRGRGSVESPNYQHDGPPSSGRPSRNNQPDQQCLAGHDAGREQRHEDDLPASSSPHVGVSPARRGRPERWTEPPGHLHTVGVGVCAFLAVRGCPVPGGRYRGLAARVEGTPGRRRVWVAAEIGQRRQQGGCSPALKPAVEGPGRMRADCR